MKITRTTTAVPQNVQGLIDRLAEVSISRLFPIIFSLALAMAIMSCAGGSPAAPPAQASPIFVSIAQNLFTVLQDSSLTFTAAVSGTSNTAVTWSVQEGVAGGTITSTGVYTAPKSAGTYHVVAVSQADPSKSATAEVLVPAIAISVSPANPFVPANGTQLFKAVITGSLNVAVNWSVLEGAPGGTITAAGLYTAPAALGTYHVVGVAAADDKKSSMAVVIVPPVSISVNPISQVVGPASVRQINANVVGLVNTAVTWKLQEPAIGGTVSPAGVYTAGSTTGLFHVTATSQADTRLNATATVSVAPSGFTNIGNMIADRRGHTMTRLADGKVLVVGGLTNGSLCDSYYACEIAVANEVYDPATSTFKETGAVHVPRLGHTATLLANGKVLITGGSNASSVVTATAELFDPSTGTFAETITMSIPRSCHTATLLNSGKVLIAGGSCNASPQASAELYDPATGAFSPTGSMGAPRNSHTATLLPNGKVLITGGTVAGVAIATAEIYDPTTGTFTSVGSMNTARSGHTATLLLNGKVLLAGSYVSAPAEIFDPATGVFAIGAVMASPRNSHTATLLPSGNVLIAGGISLDGPTKGNVIPDAELFDPGTGSFALTGNMSDARVGHQAVLLLNGKVLVAGGSNDALAELYQ